MKTIAVAVSIVMLGSVLVVAVAREWRPSFRTLDRSINGGLVLKVQSPLPPTLGLPPGTAMSPYGTKLGLPPGITLSPAGKLTGRPTVAGTFLFQLQVTDASGATSARWFTITITDNLIAQSPKEMEGYR